MSSKEAVTMFYINPTVAKADIDNIRRLANTLPRARVEVLSKNVVVPKQARTVVACGGDGTALAIAEQLESDQTLVIDPRGSHNGLANNLLHEESYIYPSQLADPEVLQQIKPFKPGLVNEKMFIHGTGWDSVALMQADVTENIRWVLPPMFRSLRFTKTMRAYIGAAWAAVRHIHQTNQEFPVSLALLSGYLGPHKITDTQTLYSDTVLIARIPGGNDLVSRLSQIYFNLFLKKIPPHGLITFLQPETFSEQTDQLVSRVVVDGEVKALDTPVPQVTIKRSDKGIRAALLVSSTAA